MSAIANALADLEFTVPEEIRRAAFMNCEQASCGINISLETRIREAVIQPRVIKDINLMGGAQTYIPLDFPVRSEYIDPLCCVYYIPDEFTQQRTIVQAYGIFFGIMGYQNAGHALHYTENTMAAASRKVIDSARQVAPAQTSYVNMIAHNVLMVRYIYLPSQTAFLSCRLTNDDELNTIRPPSYIKFSELVEHAVKAYIYNKMYIKMGEAYLHGGQALGEFKDQVMEWRDSETLYRELRIKWMKIQQHFNDPEGRRKHLRTVVGAPQ